MARCAACGAENRDGARFCDGCAAQLAPAVESREQRKTVTVVFCDVTGSTALGEQLDVESFRHVMARYFEEARNVIDRHGGTVEKFIGDAVMAVFGVPVLHEDDALRAVRAAAELRASIGMLNRELERDYGTALELRIGVNTGEVVTGTEERLATGDAVNIAARLQQAAQPGEILLGRDTLVLVRDALTVEGLDPLELKGKSLPVAAYRLTSVEPGAPGFARRLDAPMVGRVHERKLLDDAFANAVRQQSCVLFTLLGTAGVGKSRLVREFLAGVDARVVAGRCLSYGEGITYWPVVEVLKQLGGTGRQLLADTPAAAAALGAVLGESASATTSEEIAWAMRKLLEVTAAERPLVVVFDDVHWGEPTFLDLLEHVADLSRDAPILLLCVARPELLDCRPGWGGGKFNATTVLLQPLDASETDTLIERLLGSLELDASLIARIRTAAEGNPLFVEEMLAMVQESGTSDVTVPPTIKALLAARLDQLDPAERGVLERGSVEGQLFHRSSVEALASPPGPAERQLAGLVRKELVRPDRPQLLADDAYRFRHLLIRDAAYDALPKAARAELHERFADWLEDRSDDLVEQDEIVGYHLEQAYRYRGELGRIDANGEKLAVRAATLLAISARHARSRADWPAAAGLLTRAADIHAPDRLSLLPELAEALFEAGELARAADVLDEASSLARAAGDERIEAIATVRRAAVSTHIGDHSVTVGDVVLLADQAAVVLERLGDERQLAATLEIAGRYLYFSGQSRSADTVLERAGEVALRAGDLPRAQSCMFWRAAAMTFGHASASETTAFLEQLPAELLSTGLARPMLLALAGLNAAFVGEFTRGRARLAEAKLVLDELGMRLVRDGMTMHAGLLELLADDLPAAERELRNSFDRLGELGETGFRSTVATMLAEALRLQDRDDEAEAVLDTADQLIQAGDIDPMVRTRSVRAQILRRRGELEEAERLAREAVVIAAATDYLLMHANALLALADVLRAQGAVDDATDCLREALELFERKEVAVLAEKTREVLRSTAPV